jgi:hypothetical protein
VSGQGPRNVFRNNAKVSFFLPRPYEIRDLDTAKPYVRWMDTASGLTDFSIEGNQLTMKWSGGETTYTKITL